MRSPDALPHAVAAASRSPRFWQSCFAAVLLLGLGFAAAYTTDLPKFPLNTPRVSTVALMTLHPADDKVQDVKPDAPLPIDLYRFALNEEKN